jgi:hypothetical protein
MKAIKTSLLTFTMLASLAVWNSSCKKEITGEPLAGNSISSARNQEPGFADNDMVMYWNEKTSIVLGGPGTPPSQIRYFAMVQIAVHDALNAIKPKYQRFALLNEREQLASADAAVASAAYWAIKGMNLQDAQPIDAWYEESLATVPDGEAEEAGKALGKKAADAIIANRADDNFIQANLTAAPFLPDGVAPGEYRSTLPYSNAGMPKVKSLPLWGTMMKPFSVASNSQFRPGAPHAVNSDQYTADYIEIKNKGARIDHTRTSDESEIGVFWVERSAIGWNRFARNLIKTTKMDAWKTARLFALMHTAMADGASGCFEAKYHYFYWRPETAVRLADTDGNPNTIGNATWLPSYTEIPNVLNPAQNAYTPPIPDYPSAHANFGGAAAEILKLFFGTDNVSVDQTSLTLPGVTRHYSSISQAARDNSLSRVYVGFHFRKACMAGEEQGRQIANFVFTHSFRENED